MFDVNILNVFKINDTRRERSVVPHMQHDQIDSLMFLLPTYRILNLLLNGASPLLTFVPSLSSDPNTTGGWCEMIRIQGRRIFKYQNIGPRPAHLLATSPPAPLTQFCGF